MDNPSRKKSGAGRLIDELKVAEMKGRSDNSPCALNTSSHSNNLVVQTSLSLIQK